MSLLARSGVIVRVLQTCTLTEWFADAGPQLGSCGGTRTALANWATRFSQIRP
jgi:hypothetical protein